MAFLWCMVAGFLLLSTVAAGQEEEILKKPEISTLHIYSDVKYRFATTRVTSRIKNVDITSREAIFDVTLPNEAFITNLTLEIDGKLIVGEIKEKEVAKQQYEAAKQRGESAGYIGTRHRETNRFNLAVTVAPQSKVSFNLTYQELLKRKHGHYEHVIYIDPGQPVSDMDISVNIIESREITMLRVPPLRNDVNEDIEDLSTITLISQPTPETAEIKFVPSIEFQTVQSAAGMAGQFVVQYDVEREMDGGDVLLVNGYFVHFFAPEGFQPIPNDVLFILDVSGSMTGTKLSQLKSAMLSIMEQLNEGDRINIMTFSGTTSFWKTEMADIKNEDVQEEAKQHIKDLRAGGWTNIELAMRNGIEFLGGRISTGEVRSPVIVFLTDGEATQGVTNSDLILDSIRKQNEGEIPVFTLAFGQYADYTLVKKIAVQNNGIGRKIYEASDAAMQIAGFYNEISVTLLSNVTFQYLDAPVADVTKNIFTNYFNGSEIVVCGRVDSYDLQDYENLNLKIHSNSVKGTNLVLSGLNERILDISSNITDTGDFEMITEKVWAYLTIKQLLDKELGAQTEDEKTAYRKQVLGLSLQYGFVTPLTSMVVTLPEEDGTSEKTRVMSEKASDTKHDLALSSSQGKAVSNSFRTGVHRAPPPLPGLPGASGMYMQHFLRPPPSAIGSYQAFYAFDLDNDYSVSSKLGGTGLQNMNLVKLNSKRQNQRTRRRKNKKNKNKNRINRKNNVPKFPLSVQLPNINDPMCLNIYDPKLDTEPGTYLLYSDTDNDLRLMVTLTARKQGKHTQQAAIQELHLISGKSRRTISSVNDVPVENPGDIVPWTVTSDSSGKVIELPTLNISISVDDRFLMLTVKGLSDLPVLSGTGIINQLLSKDIRLKKEIKKQGNKKTKPAKVFGVFRVEGKKAVAIQRNMSNSVCWNLKPNFEERIVDMTVALSTLDP